MHYYIYIYTSKNFFGQNKGRGGGGETLQITGSNLYHFSPGQQQRRELLTKVCLRAALYMLSRADTRTLCFCFASHALSVGHISTKHAKCPLPAGTAFKRIYIEKYIVVSLFPFDAPSTAAHG